MIAAVNASQDHGGGSISGVTLDLFADAIADNPPQPSPDFSLSVASPSRTVATSGGASYTITVVPSNGFIGAVDFSVSGLPDGASASFDPPSVNTSGSTTMMVTKSLRAQEGAYSLTITVGSRSLQRTIQVTLAVARPPISPPSPGHLRVP